MSRCLYITVLVMSSSNFFAFDFVHFSLLYLFFLYFCYSRDENLCRTEGCVFSNNVPAIFQPGFHFKLNIEACHVQQIQKLYGEFYVRFMSRTARFCWKNGMKMKVVFAVEIKILFSFIVEVKFKFFLKYLLSDFIFYGAAI